MANLAEQQLHGFDGTPVVRHVTNASAGSLGRRARASRIVAPTAFNAVGTGEGVHQAGDHRLREAAPSEAGRTSSRTALRSSSTEIRRNAEGYVLDARGEVVTERGGRPSRRGSLERSLDLLLAASAIVSARG